MFTVWWRRKAMLSLPIYAMGQRQTSAKRSQWVCTICQECWSICKWTRWRRSACTCSLPVSTYIEKHLTSAFTYKLWLIHCSLHLISFCYFCCDVSLCCPWLIITRPAPLWVRIPPGQEKYDMSSLLTESRWF